MPWYRVALIKRLKDKEVDFEYPIVILVFLEVKLFGRWIATLIFFDPRQIRQFVQANKQNEIFGLQISGICLLLLNWSLFAALKF